MAERIRRRAAEELPAALVAGLHPVLRRVYARRGIRYGDELDLRLARLSPPDGMLDLEPAAEALARAVLERDRIVVVGDYDADGATATTLMYLALQRLAAACGGVPEQIAFFVPDRFELGYGLSPEVVDRLRTLNPRWLVTVDNGVSSLEGVAAARSAGMGVIVTDHHTPGERLPQAEAVVDPQRPDDRFASPHLAGVGVAFYVAVATSRALERSGAVTGEVPNLADLLDLVAVGTVADLVPLDHNNRILVEQGLRRMRAGSARPGIQALLELSNCPLSEVAASDLAFFVAPRLNAAGRMDDMTAGVECLLAADLDAARQAAAGLDRLNRQRREVELKMTEGALSALESSIETVGLGVCVTADDWHQGVTGIVASRLKERFNRPAIAFAPGGDGKLRGSARSIPGLHMRDLLARLHHETPDLIERFGGHAMAAGLTIAGERFACFRDAFAAALEEALSDGLPDVVHASDGPLDSEEMTLETATALRRGGPWGVGFPEPRFDGWFDIVNCRPLRGGHVRLSLRPLEGTGPELAGIAFGGVERGWHRLNGPARAVYGLDINHYRGETTLQLRIDYLTPQASYQP